ncbi:hypothetical protein H2199_004686 [Coniosporium tulheliwenetii]|uniref:Uncharacterized protein n=1 Tax=Coniosporium tulheliwenetii TaxID=3383036 RepID=A0ACC2Z4R0_9PEZI|nr:hypothetical protein H2199_004686 [Cladosporium sp. JES 115]
MAELQEEKLETAELLRAQPEQIIRILAEFIKYSPRIGALATNLADQVVKRQEKAIVWVLYLIEQLLIGGIPEMMGIDALHQNKRTKTEGLDFYRW